MNEIQALQNAADDLNLVIHEKHRDDKRKTVKMYFAQLGAGTVSPVLDYKNMNCFLLGWRAAINKSTTTPTNTL